LRHQLTLFALVNLGLVESLADGLLSATDAVRLFYNFDNGLFVHKQTARAKIADEIMSHGAQLPDVSMCYPPRRRSSANFVAS